MASHRFTRPRMPSSRRIRLIAPLVAVAAVAVTAFVVPAGAAGSQGATLHEDADHAGSTVRAHEGGSTNTVNPHAVAGVPGMDVSNWQGNVNWTAAWNNGARFAYVKATEGTGYTNPSFAQQYNGSFNVGMIRGAYHFARPDISSGATQANYFVGHGGGWSRDGRTLPPMLDIEYNPYGATCYGLSQSAMVNWIASFSNQMKARTSRYVTIYTTTNWWSTCTGNYGGFGSTNPLFIARYASSAGTLPAGWGFYTIWQYADSGTFPGDQDTFNGTSARLVALANG